MVVISTSCPHAVALVYAYKLYIVRLAKPSIGPLHGDNR